MSKRSTVNKGEIDHFDSIAHEWWNRDGAFKMLHKLNPTRIEYIRRSCDVLGKNLLDVGCGGGLMSLPLARLGASVTAIDASSKNIEVASKVAKDAGLDINFQHTSVEDFNASGFDIIVAFEIIEHVDNPEDFIQELAKKLKKGGILFMATVNKTLKSLVFAKFAAEYVLRIVPIGTHSWDKFIEPQVLEEMARFARLEKMNEAGLKMSFPSFEFSLDSDLSINYFMSFVKK